MSLYSMMCKSIYEKCTTALKDVPGWKLAVLAAIPAACGVMGGITMDAMHSVNVMTEGGGVFAHVTPEGAAAYKALLAEKATVAQDTWGGVVKQGLEWGFKTDGANVMAISAGAMPTLPFLAIIAKAAAHFDEMIRGKPGTEKNGPDVDAGYDAGPSR